MNQKQRAAEIVLKIEAAVDSIRQNVDALELVLDEAQNVPPEGTADGSLEDSEWNLLTDCVRTLRHADRILHEVARGGGSVRGGSVGPTQPSVQTNDKHALATALTVAAGYHQTITTAVCRAIVSKHGRDLAFQKSMFVDGAVKRGLTTEIGAAAFDLLVLVAAEEFQ